MPDFLVDAFDTPANRWIPPPGDADLGLRAAVFAGLFETLRQEVGLGQPAAFATVRESVPPPDAVPGDFARRIEGQLGFLQKAARRWHREKAQADDLVQDTVVQALANAHLWRGDQPDSNLRGWLFTIMRNRFLAGRVRWKRSETALDAIAAADECVPAVASRPEARLMMRDAERALTSAVPPADRDPPCRHRGALAGLGGAADGAVDGGAALSPVARPRAPARDSRGKCRPAAAFSPRRMQGGAAKPAPAQRICLMHVLTEALMLRRISAPPR